MNETNFFDGDVKSQVQVFQHLYNAELLKNEESEKRWTKLKEDYECLERQLSDLPKELTKDVMVPIGPRALMKGKIVHTNEILVRLGDDWFAKRSAAQASEICLRRLALCQEKLAALEKEKQFLMSKKEFPLQEEAYGEREIVEVCTEEELQQWRADHRLKEKEYRKQLAEMRSKETDPIDSEEALWKRLDELELQEELQDELNRLKGVDDDEEEEEEEDDYEDYDDEDEDDVGVDYRLENILGSNGLIQKEIVVHDHETGTGRLRTSERRVSFPTNSVDDEGASDQMSTSSSGRRVSFADLPSEQTSQTDDSKSSSSVEIPGSHSAPNLHSLNTGDKANDNDQISLKSPKSILKIKNSDPSTIYTHEPHSNLTDDESDPDVDSVILPPPVSSAVLEHNPEEIASNEASSNRPLSRFRAARSNKR